MNESFLAQIESVLASELHASRYEFQHSGKDVASEESRVYFRGPASTLMLYDSPRNGEVNARVCLRHLPTSALSGSSEYKWHYLREFVPEPRTMSMEQLLERVPAKPISTEAQLQQIGALLKAIELPEIKESSR